MENRFQKKEKTIQRRQEKEKRVVLEHLKKMPIVQVACERAHIGRATYYRWRKEDSTFRTAADEAFDEGEAFITDMSESQVMSLIREKHWPAIRFWLQHHHPKYAPKLEVTQTIFPRVVGEDEYEKETQGDTEERAGKEQRIIVVGPIESEND